MRTWSLAAGLSLLLTIAGRAAAASGMPDVVTERGRIIDGIYQQVFIAGVIVFLFVMALMLFILVRYREKSGKGRITFEKERDNIKAEMAWTLIPLVIVLWVGVISYQALVDLDGIGEQDLPEPELALMITGFQWFWQADYGDGLTVSALPGPEGSLANVDPFVVPADVPIRFDVTGADVIHSFNIVGLSQTLDAVPGVVNSILVKDGIPEGDYFTQCKENCLNPGHGYMRAMVKAVPMDEYEQWLEAARAGAAAGLTQHIPVVANGGDLSTDKPLLLAQGATVRLQIANEGAAQTFSVGDQSVDIAAGEVDSLEVVAGEAGTLVLEGDAGSSLEFTIREAQEIDVELGAFVLIPEDIELETGEVYIFNVVNTHSTGHNIFIGMDGGDGVQEGALWSSATLGPGGEDTFIVVPTEAGTLETWCAVAGHYGAGMHGTLTIV